MTEKVKILRVTTDFGADCDDQVAISEIINSLDDKDPIKTKIFITGTTT